MNKLWRVAAEHMAPNGAGNMKIERPDSPWRGILDGVWAVIWIGVSQFIIMGLELALKSSTFPFPAAILAMLVIFTLMVCLGYFWKGLGKAYDRFLRGPADLVNRHMSIGFSVPIVLLCRLPLASSNDIGLIIACFIILGVLATVLGYIAAFFLQKLLIDHIRLRFRRRQHQQRPRDEEQAHSTGIHHEKTPQTNQPENRHSVVDSRKEFISEASSLASVHGLIPDEEQDPGPANQAAEEVQLEEPLETLQPEQQNQLPNKWQKVLACFLSYPLTILCWLTVAVAVPLRFAAEHESILGISLLFTIWATTLTLQTVVRKNHKLSSWPRLRTCLAVSLNAVLWTALGLIAYAFAEARWTALPLPEVLDSLQRNTTWADLVLRRKTSVAAGDVAQAVLNAGLVSWGFKLWEYRSRLVSSAGVTIAVVSCTAAMLNVVAGPLLAYCIGVRGPGRALAFAARSVTLALGGPALARLGGDTSLNAAMVVANGIVFQMALGLGAGQWLEDKACVLARRWKKLLHGKSLVHGEAGTEEEAVPDNGEQQSCGHGSKCTSTTTPRSVAAGVTIGINAAAMGTAHLYETHSDAAPFSALSMTVYGVATVGFSLIPQLASWILNTVGAKAA